MNSYLKNPNLPDGKVTELICGGLNKEIIDYFEKRNIRILYTAENQKIDKSVSKHCDLSVLYLGNGKIITDITQNELTEKLKEEGFETIKTHKAVKGFYPNDCILNHTIISDFIIGNSKIFDESVKKHCSNFKVLHTNQGYCKCSVLVVDENSIISDDESVSHIAFKNGLDCLLVRKGDIFLEGHEYGFIGGASGKISPDEIVFFGDITKHSDYDKIRDFIEKRMIKIISFDFPLTDFGGIVPVKENIF